MISIDSNNSPNRDSNKSSTMLAHACMLCTAIVWGLSFVSTSVLTRNGLHPVEIYLYRFILAYLILLAISHRYFRAYTWRDEFLFLILGLSGGSLYFITENIAIARTEVANVSLITTLSPLITTFMMGALYKNERPGRWIVMGSIIAAVGVALVVFGGEGEASFNPVGDLLALAAAVSFSIYSIVIKKINPTYSTWFITRKTFFYGIITALPFLAMEPEHAPMEVLLRTEVWGNIAFLGLVCSLTAYLILALSIKVLGPITASNYLYAQPIVTMIAGIVILSQPVSWGGWTGCVLIIGGLWLGEALTRRSQRR